MEQTLTNIEHWRGISVYACFANVNTLEETLVEIKRAKKTFVETERVKKPG